MNPVNFGERYSSPVTLCMGHYESLHKGHTEIIKTAAQIAERNGSEVMLMTFDERLNPRFGRVILTYPERLERAASLGVKAVLRIDFNEEFADTPAENFLVSVSEKLNLKCIVCGYDFRYGKGRAGDANSLEAFCKTAGIEFRAVEKVALNGEKISSSAVKKALSAGDVSGANSMLGYRYFIRGNVEEGRQDGRKMGFPTANVVWPSNKFEVKKGVYATRSVIDGEEFLGITNFGAAPTFGSGRVLTETHYVNLKKDLYGREVTLQFDAFLRDIRRFSTVTELKEQLENDLKKVLRI